MLPGFHFVSKEQYVYIKHICGSFTENTFSLFFTTVSGGNYSMVTFRQITHWLKLEKDSDHCKYSKDEVW